MSKMTFSDPMFLIEIVVEELKSFAVCKEFVVKAQFTDVFSIVLKDRFESDNLTSNVAAKKHLKRKKKSPKISRILIKKSPQKTQAGQAILLESDMIRMIANMKKYSMELSLWSKYSPDYKIASTNIPWSNKSVGCLTDLFMNRLPDTISMRGEYNVFDEIASRRMAVINVNIKFSCLPDVITSQFSCPQEKTSLDLSSTVSLETKTVQKKHYNLAEETGIIKTIYSGEHKKLSKKSKHNKAKAANDFHKASNVTVEEFKLGDYKRITDTEKVSHGINSLRRSDTDIDKDKQIDLMKSKSCSLFNQDNLNIMNYFLGENTGPFGNQTYCVSYFTVENKLDSLTKTPSNGSPTKESSKSPSKEPSKSLTRVSSKTTNKITNSEKNSNDPKPEKAFKMKLCDKDCENKKRDSDLCTLSICSLDIPPDIPAEVMKCHKIDCQHRIFRKLPVPPDDRILLNLNKDCCKEKLEEVVGGIKGKLKIGEKDPCYCECECRFGFMKKTTYCKICGGYEQQGDELAEHRQYEMPHPCPIYHKLGEKPKRPASITSDTTKKPKKTKEATEKSHESERESIKKSKKKKKDNKFKFDYGYTAPHIGHSRCAISCDDTIHQIPKRMGWLWTAENVPGLKFRPSWKPGAVNKHVLRLLRIAKDPGLEAMKKNRKRKEKPKKSLKRPLLIVHKKDGEFTVTLESMKSYVKPRQLNQAPYEDKPPLTYTIGRTEEENKERRLKKERAQRRLERDQRDFIQNAFRDMCQEICLKTYQQALGILPDTEAYDCSCYPAEPGADRTDLDHSCSCSDDSIVQESDTDSDEWIVEFTPPTAHFDPTYTCKKVSYAENGSQYTYLDYRVKLLDRFGNPVPRFFTSLDGQQQCSDLGGFWGPDKKWLEINIDGYIAPDGRWAPMAFQGPNGELVDGEEGKFQAMDGSWLVVGIDGYVDTEGNWRYYGKAKAKAEKKKRRELSQKKTDDKKDKMLADKKSDTMWSCFGDVTPKQLSLMGIMGHGHDRKLLLNTLNQLIKQGQNVKIPEQTKVPRTIHGKVKRKKEKFYDEPKICKHSASSSKGITAVDEHGRKTYFKTKYCKNKRPQERIAALTHQGISVSSFHAPCFRSFVSSELMKKEQLERLWRLADKRPKDDHAAKHSHTNKYEKQGETYTYVV